MVKSVDSAVVGVEILKHWQQLKIYGMLLKSYLGEGKMELLKREIELSTGIQLKTFSHWLIIKNQLKKVQTTGNNWGFAIVMTVKGETKAKKLYVLGLRF